MAPACGQGESTRGPGHPPASLRRLTLGTRDLPARPELGLPSPRLGHAWPARPCPLPARPSRAEPHLGRHRPGRGGPAPARPPPPRSPRRRLPGAARVSRSRSRRRRYRRARDMAPLRPWLLRCALLCALALRPGRAGRCFAATPRPGPRPRQVRGSGGRGPPSPPGRRCPRRAGAGCRHPGTGRRREPSFPAGPCASLGITRATRVSMAMCRSALNFVRGGKGVPRAPPGAAWARALPGEGLERGPLFLVVGLMLIPEPGGRLAPAGWTPSSSWAWGSPVPAACSWLRDGPVQPFTQRLGSR